MNFPNEDIFDRSPSAVSPKQRRDARTRLVTILIGVLAIMVASGCATKNIQSERLVDEKLPRPRQILVHDFVATPNEVPADSTIARGFSVEPSTQTAEQTATGRKLGSQIAAELTGHLQSAGLPARHVPMGATPPTTAVNDIVIRGYLLSIKEGSAAKRVTIGFGSGSSELHAAAETFQVTPEGLRSLGSGTGQFGSTKAPGAAVGAAGFAATGNPAGLIVSSGVKLYGEASGSSTVQGRAKTAAKEIGKVLEKRARELGWIK